MPNIRMQQLRQVPLFAKLDRDDMRALVKMLERKEYQAGDVICRQGQAGDSAYYVIRGELSLVHVDRYGVEREVNTLGPDDYFGETSLLLGEPRDVTVKVIQDTIVLYISKADFDRLLDERPAMRDDMQMRADVAQKYRARESHFEWQDEGEDVLVCEHRHMILLYRSLIVPAFLVLVTLAGGILGARAIGPTIPLCGGGGIITALLLFMLYLALDHRDERYIVTNKRVVRREHVPLGRESLVTAPLRTIQDIQELQVGLLSQWFDFGDLIIETAGEKAHVAFREIPDPEGVREIIFEQIRRSQADAKAGEREAIRVEMRRYFDTQSMQKKAPPPEQPSEEQDSKPGIADVLRSIASIFTYFLPPLRHEQGDTITWRKHWIALLKPISIPSLLLVVSTIATLLLFLPATGNLRVFILVVYGIVLIILLPWWLWKFDDWQNDIYQVTPTRIIDVERLPFYLREERREANLGMIQNVQFEIPGFVGRVFNFGSVTIETAGAGAFTFDLVKNPSNVQAEIFRRMEAFQASKSKASADQHRNELLDWFAVYHEEVRRSTSQPPSLPQQEA